MEEKNEQTLVLTRGLPGSGKDTFALGWIKDRPDWVRVNRDELRLNLFNLPVLSHPDEELITSVQVAAVKAALAQRKSVIISDTNLRAKTVRMWLELADRHKVDVQIVDIDTPLEECILRNQIRGNNGGRMVPESVIRRMYSQYFTKGRFPEVPKINQGETSNVRTYVPDESLPGAYIFDVDGTTQLNTGSRGFFDWHRVHEDTPHEPVIEIARRLKKTGASIVVLSGRDAVCRDLTLSNLEAHGMPVDALFMRPKGSMEKDSKVKTDLFFSHVAPNWNVLGVFDDRQSVVDTWREMGILCLQVADGDF